MKVKTTKLDLDLSFKYVTYYITGVQSILCNIMSVEHLFPVIRNTDKSVFSVIYRMIVRNRFRYIDISVVVVSTILIICATETAENIGYSCNLLREEMNEVFIISGNSPEDVRQELRSEEVSWTHCFLSD